MDSPFEHRQLRDNPITTVEIKVGLFSMEEDEAPALDGFITGFYKFAWDILDANIWEAVLAPFFSKMVSFEKS